MVSARCRDPSAHLDLFGELRYGSEKNTDTSFEKEVLRIVPAKCHDRNAAQLLV